MNVLGKTLHALPGDECGSEKLEYALIIGLILATAAAVISAIGTKVFGRWSPGR